MQFRIAITATVFSVSSLCAQEPLSVGDPVPNTPFDTVLNFSSPKAKLSDFKGKLLILDFWATWCTSCIHALPKMDSLQKQFSKDLKVLMVNTKSTRDDLQKVKVFIKRWKERTGKALPLTVVVGDSLTQNLFPHQLIPHYVWIGRDGRVLAFTASSEVTAQNIRAVLLGQPLQVIMKRDQDTERPLFLNKDLPEDRLLSYSILIKGWYEGLPSGNRIREKDGVVRGRAITNTCLLDMYRSVASHLDSSLKTENFIVITKDSSELFPLLHGKERANWFREHAYSLDVVVSTSEASQLFQRMLEVLNRESRYIGTFEKQEKDGHERKVFLLRKKY